MQLSGNWQEKTEPSQKRTHKGEFVLLLDEKQLTLFETRLPSFGFATDDLLYGVRFLPLSQLIQKAIIQFNWRHSIGFLAYDLDSDTAQFDWEDDHKIPPPNILVLNPNNGHAHYLYALEKPVHKYTGASEKALRYLASIDIAMTATLHADPGYTKLLCKNPLSDKWVVFYPRHTVYDLDELESWLDMDAYRDRRRKLPAVGYGRNCNLFHSVRQWAYSARRTPFLSEELFRDRVLIHGMSLNAEFTPPMANSEVRAIVKSITRWTWRNMSAAGFKQRGNQRRGKSIITRQAKAAALRQRIVEAVEQCPNLTQADIAAMMGCSQQAVSYHLNLYQCVVSDKGSIPTAQGDLDA